MRPARGGQEVTITSFVREFRGCDAFLECTMSDAAGKTLARCAMVATYIDRQTKRPATWPEETQALFFETAAA